MSQYAQSYISMHRHEKSIPNTANLCRGNMGGGKVECRPWAGGVAGGWRFAIHGFTIRWSTLAVRQLLYFGLGATKSLAAEGMLPGDGSWSTRAEEPQHCRQREAWWLLSLLHSLLGWISDGFWWQSRWLSPHAVLKYSIYILDLYDTIS